MKRLTVVLAVFFLIATIAGCNSSFKFTPNQPPAAQTRVAFLHGLPQSTPQAPARVGPRPNAARPMSPMADNAQIWTMKGDGTDAKQVISDGRFAGVDLSPDGTKLAVNTFDWSYSEIYVANVDGDVDPTLISDVYEDGDCWAGLPEFSPDGTRVYFMCDGWDLWSNNLAGNDPRKVPIDWHTTLYSYAVAPDGTILVEGDLGEEMGIGRVMADGTVNPLIPGGSRPEFNAAGTKLTYALNRDIYVYDVAAQTATRLTNTADNADPTFVGDKVLFVSWRDADEDADIFSIDMNGPAGSEQMVTPDNDAEDWFGEFIWT